MHSVVAMAVQVRGRHTFAVEEVDLEAVDQVVVVVVMVRDSNSQVEVHHTDLQVEEDKVMDDHLDLEDTHLQDLEEEDNILDIVQPSEVVPSWTELPLRVEQDIPLVEEAPSWMVPLDRVTP